jgi:hypothetical protein
MASFYFKKMISYRINDVQGMDWRTIFTALIDLPPEIDEGGDGI